MIESQGKIQNKKRLTQVPEFNLSYQSPEEPWLGTQSPTDVDCLFEYQGKVVVFVDFKLEGKSLERGQKYTFTHIVDALQLGGYEGAYIIEATHNTPIDQQFYDASICVVTRLYNNKKWIEPPYVITFRQMLEKIFKLHNLPLVHTDVLRDELFRKFFS